MQGLSIEFFSGGRLFGHVCDQGSVQDALVVPLIGSDISAASIALVAAESRWAVEERMGCAEVVSDTVEVLQSQVHEGGHIAD